MRGLIIKSISGQYSVYAQDDQIYVCKPKGTFRLNEISPKVGDKVLIDIDTKTILEVETRKNELVRPFVSNVDKMFLIFSVKEPELNFNLLDRMLAILEYNAIESIIIFTKIDLLTDVIEFEKVVNYYEKIGYKVYKTSKYQDVSFLEPEFKDSISVFAGQSGAGKSSLLNKLDANLELHTQEISYALGRGKHTTRHTELHALCGGWIADTPGFGTIEFPFPDLLSFSHSFKEFFEASGNCKFNGCLHINEPGCEVKRLVDLRVILNSRYNNYLSFKKEVEENIKNKY